MTKVRYDGPADHILVLERGAHQRGEVRDYPADLAEELAASERQRFTIMDAPKTPETEATPKAKGKNKKR